MPVEIRERATSLLALAGVPVDRVALLGALLDALSAEVVALEGGDARCRACARRSWLDGRRVEVDTGAETISGRAAGIADDGSLLLDTETGRVSLSVGEVARVHEMSAVAVLE